MFEYESGVIEAKLQQKKKVLAEGVSFSLREGQTLCILGETGSGKTIIAHSVMGLLPKNVTQNGEKVILDGRALVKDKERRKLLGDKIVYIPQSGHESLSPTKKIKYQLFDGLKKIKIPYKERYAEAAKALKRVGFEDPYEGMEKYPFELSGGMAQRVVFAIALCSRARLVIADEPTNGVDEQKKFKMIDLLQTLFPTAVKILITHDISLAARADKILVLCKGKVMEQGGKSVLSHPKHPYTKALLGALVENGMQQTPVLREGNSFCGFYRRCPLANEKCLGEFPYRTDEEGKWYCANVES